ncbi:tyrosine-type recombinase/integrase [Muricomes intestini]|mgnify:CR=1 FL=1|jgi:site-specific recombinase XerD|uniref:tyrosine-type recombinase/integrase n=1 Tax=Muricomes intestini TaxID=1796634 RepID=UPI000E981FCE|nr:hypothetical protein [Lachnospiraceae bacterium]HCR82180.1 hypothetical protein [Lachnospiraceae bacterium]
MKRDCTDLTEEMLAAMRSDNYSHKSVDTHVRYAYRVLIRFCTEHFKGNYSVEAGDAFMTSILEKELSKQHTFLYRNSIERLNHALTGDYHWRPVKNKCKPYATSCFDSIITEYESYLLQTGKTKTHVRSHIHLVARFLAYVESAGITKICAIKAANVHEGFNSFADKEGFQKKMKTFFRYAYKYGLTDQDISCWVPAVSRNKPIPTVYTVEETDQILRSIDRNTSRGKRDYCIVLMATKLGIRACDLISLTLADINRSGGVIRIVQQKTDVSVEFPLLDEIAEALDDYLNNARPSSDIQNLFLTVPRPDTFALSTPGIYAVVSDAIVRSGIDIHSRRRGSNSLRSSLASQLLDEGRSYSEIQQILGHTSPDVARHYIRVEIERLRECALEVPVFQSETVTAYLEGQVINS